MQRYHYIFRGFVQGVGFRYRAGQYAMELGLTGWVKNLANGHVEMEIQGSRDKIEKLLDKLHHSPWIEIEGYDVMPIDPKPEEKKFKVRF